MNNEDLRRDMEAFIAHHHATDVGDILDAGIVEDTGEDTDDALLEAITGAVQTHTPQYLGDEGGANPTPGTPPPANSVPTSSTPPTGLSLNAGVDGDEQLTAWLNNRLNS
jgi:hypothetical protein